MTWINYLIEHYKQRLAEEKTIEGRSFIRQTLHGLINSLTEK